MYLWIFRYVKTEKLQHKIFSSIFCLNPSKQQPLNFHLAVMQWIFRQSKFYRHLDLQTGLLYAWNNLDKSTRYLFHTGYFIFRSVQVLHVVLVLIYRNFTTMNRNLILVWPKLDALYLWMIHLEEIGGYIFFQTPQLFSKKSNNFIHYSIYPQLLQ